MFVKILVVSSSKKECSGIKNVLSDYFVLTAYGSFEAMKLIEENSDIDILILALDIPKKEGFNVLSALRSNPMYNNMRIIIVTNCQELDNEADALKLGANDFIRRPINLDFLKIRIDMYVELKKLNRSYDDKELEQKLVNFGTVFNQAPIGITVSQSRNTSENYYFVVNKFFEKFTGRSKEELEELGWESITHPEDLKEDLINFEKLKAGEIDGYSMDKRYLKPDGSYVWGHMIVAKLDMENSYNYTHICFVQDINERKEIERALAESERSKSVLLSHLPGLAYRCKFDEDYTMQFVSDGCYDLTGYFPENILNNRDRSYNDLIVPEYRDSLRKEWERILPKGLPFKYEYEIITINKRRKWVLEMGQGILNDSGEVEYLEGIVLDISARKRIENKFKYNSEHDIWTGLYNRSYLDDLLIKDASEANVKRALVSINLSAIHLLSMTYGFSYSQELIKRIANALKDYCTENIQLFSTSEYRFIFYVKCYNDKNDLIKFCDKVANSLEMMLSLDRIEGGIGVIEIDDENKRDIDQLKKSLSVTSERAISLNDREISYCFYDKGLHEEIIREEDIKHELSQIVTEESNGLFLQFQPIVDLKTNEIVGFEALSRIKSDKLGNISPLEFIPIAEKTKLIIPMGQKIIKLAFQFLTTLKKNGYDKIKVFINISAIQLQYNNFVKNLIDIANEMEIDPENVVVEITESLFVGNYNEINTIFSELHEHNIHIAIDDFGTGYSSLARERELKVDCIKIDKYFIDKLLLIEENESITGDIVSMFHKLGHTVIAEGVEHEKQKQYLIKYGCDKIQGYLISKPTDADTAINMLNK